MKKNENGLPLRLQPDVESEDDVEAVGQRKRDHMAHVDETRLPFDSVGGCEGEIDVKYAAWYKLWCDVYVPKLMCQKDGFRTDRDLQVNDLVYYQKKDGGLGSAWVMGSVDQVVRGRDGVIRKVVVRYQNSKEEFTRVTERSARTLIKLWSIDDPDLQSDLAKVQARIEELQGIVGEVSGQSTGLMVKQDGDHLTGELVRREDIQLRVCGCCCLAHCVVNLHNLYGSKCYQHPLLSHSSFELTGSVGDGWSYFLDELEEKKMDEEDTVKMEEDILMAYIMRC